MNKTLAILALVIVGCTTSRHGLYTSAGQYGMNTIDTVVEPLSGDTVVFLKYVPDTTTIETEMEFGYVRPREYRIEDEVDTLEARVGRHGGDSAIHEMEGLREQLIVAFALDLVRNPENASWITDAVGKQKWIASRRKRIANMSERRKSYLDAIDTDIAYWKKHTTASK